MMFDQHVQVNVQVFRAIQLQTNQSQTVQQHENLQLIVESQVDQLLQHVATHSSPVCPHQQTTVAKYPFHRSRGDRRTEEFHAS